MFREAVSFTAAETGFSPRLIEKDYYCTVLLSYFFPVDRLVFKGGTCLAKVLAHFYRLSEDLDSMISMPAISTRKQRRAAVQPVKEVFARIGTVLPMFRVSDPLEGRNESAQYIAALEYDSSVLNQREVIRCEIGLREPLLDPPETRRANTLLLDPVTGRAFVAPVPCSCISWREAYAKKFGAALTRSDPAIRDFFDIDYAVRYLKLRPGERDFLDLVRMKLAVPGNGPIDVSQEKRVRMRDQLDAELKPVLRGRDYEDFDIDRAFAIATETGMLLKGSP